MHVYLLDKTRIRISHSNLLFNKTPEVVPSVTLFCHGNIKHSGVVLSEHGRIITAMETGGLHYMMTLHTLLFRIFEILHVRGVIEKFVSFSDTEKSTNFK